jgi:predicted nucleic acid-binding protein
MIARLRVAQQSGLELRSNAMVVAQAWRDRRGRQVSLARLLQATDVRAVRPGDGREAGPLLADAGTADPIDATVVLLAVPAHDDSAGAKQDQARALVGRLWESRDGCLNVQVLQEFFVNVTRIHQRTGISFWDAMIVRSAVEIGCAVLYSEDLNDGQEYSGVHVENPF